VVTVLSKPGVAGPLLREQEVGGSNPLAPTDKKPPRCGGFCFAGRCVGSTRDGRARSRRFDDIRVISQARKGRLRLTIAGCDGSQGGIPSRHLQICMEHTDLCR